MIRLHLMDPEDIDRLCRKSKWCYNAKWKWRKICDNYNIEWEFLESQMDVQIERDDEKLKKYKEKHERSKSDEQLGNESEGSAGDGSGEGEVQVAAELSRASDASEEVRSGEASDGASSNEGTE